MKVRFATSLVLITLIEQSVQKVNANAQHIIDLDGFESCKRCADANYASTEPALEDHQIATIRELASARGLRIDSADHSRAER